MEDVITTIESIENYTDESFIDTTEDVYDSPSFRTRNQIIEDVTSEYLDSLDTGAFPDPDVIETALLKLISEEFHAQNMWNKQQGFEKLKPLQKLEPSQIASIMLRRYSIINVICSSSNTNPEYDLLAKYQEDGIDRGIYSTDDISFKRIAHKYNYTINTKEFNSVMEFLKLDAPRMQRTTDRDLIAVNNGIFDFENKVLLEFDPHYIFLSKSHVDYNPTALNVVIHNNEDESDWDVESWMDELSDDSEIVQVLWELLSAIIRPHVRWNKSAWLYSETGNNGKGTLCELMRSLCGESAYAAIPISDFGKDFSLEPLTHSTAIIVDENDVGVFIDKAANLKAVITNDVIPINRKFKVPISFQFHGFMVQCLNEFPRVKDKSDSFYRRQLFIPFDKCFTGRERKYIKEDYLHRKEVLEYVLFRVLNMNFYTLSEPEACRNILSEYKEYNDPARQFFAEMEDRFVWDLLPFDFLYELYKQWFRKNAPTGSIQGKQKFISEIVQIANSGSKWYCKGKSVTTWVMGKDFNRMSGTEYLIAEYDVVDWQNKQYSGPDINKICSPKLNDTYRGLRRVGSV